MAPSSTILLFGDGSVDVKSWLHRLLYKESDSLTSKFVNEAACVLHAEVRRGRSIGAIRSNIFTGLEDISQSLEGGQLHPALHAALVVLVQLGSFISSYENHPQEPFPDEKSLCLGFCLGEISAATLSLSNSLLHLLRLAPSAVQIAFRVGLIASQARINLEPNCPPDESWSIAIDRACVSSDSVLEEFNRDETASVLQHVWVGFYDRKTTSVCGPPSSLRQFLSWLKGKDRLSPHSFVKYIQIHAPYHAPSLSTHNTVHEGVHEVVNSVPGHRMRPFVGSSCGCFVSEDVQDAETAQDIFSTVAKCILGKPMDWEKTCNDVLRAASVCNFHPRVLRKFGTNSIAQHLASALEHSFAFEEDEEFENGTKVDPQAKHPQLAVVGTAMRLPGADNVDELWQSLCEGKDLSQAIPKERFDPQTHLKRSAFGCFIKNIGDFDARFFNMSPREARQTDPGHRIAMMTALEAMENAGLVVGRTPSTQSDRIGTFYGQTVDEYKEQNMALDVDTYYIPGSLRAFAPGRLNYFFKFGGPAYAIDTACSSGAVALNLACKSIWSGECDTALAGGINTLCGCDNFNGLISGQFLSATGNCKTFDDTADGYCRAEGVCSMVIKRLDAAINDRDNILGVISGTATNFAANATSITRPHEPTQKALYNTALRNSGLHARDVNYVELHGTGTQAGDQVETTSVMDVFAPLPDTMSRKLYLGAVKSNLGHSEAASGPTSMIKALKVFQERKFPPHIGIKTIRNRLLGDLEERNVCIPGELTDYPPSQSGTRRALVSNFSAAGGCTAFIVEEKPAQAIKTGRSQRPKYPVCISAKTESSLVSNITRLSQWVANHPDKSLPDVSYTSSARRVQYEWRKTFVVESMDELGKQLTDTNHINPTTNDAPRIALAFTGQGSWYQSVSSDLLETCSIFRNYMFQYHAICVDLGFPPFMRLIKDSSMSLDKVTATESHLCIVAIEMALYQLWKSWGIVTPAAVIGHSLGEYSALFAADVLSARDTLYLVGQRASLIEARCEVGAYAMLAVQASKTSIDKILLQRETHVEIACINGPSDTVLSGQCQAISDFAASLEEYKIKSTPLQLPYGFHSSQVEPILQPFEDIVKQVRFNPPSTPVASPLLGKVVTEAGVFNASYVASQCRQAVNFVDALHALRDAHLIDTGTLWIEIGPQPLCTRMIRASLGAELTLLHSLKRGDEAWASLSAAVAAVNDAGVSIDWQLFHADSEDDLNLLDLPTYAFDLKRYWIDYNDFLLHRDPSTARKPVEPLADVPKITSSLHKLTSCQRDNDDVVHLSFETDLSESDVKGAILGHLVHGVGLCPASLYGDIALTVGNLVRDEFSCAEVSDVMSIVNMTITKPITVPKETPESKAIMRVTATALLKEQKIEVAYSLLGDDKPRATCTLKYSDPSPLRSQWARTNHLVQRSIQSVKAGSEGGTSHKLFRGLAYKLFSSVVNYEDKYQGMYEVTTNSKELEAVALLRLYQGEKGGRYFCSPFWIDAIIHVAGFVMNANETIDLTKGVYISGGWGEFKLLEAINPDQEYQVYVKMVSTGKNMVAGNVVLLRGHDIVGVVEDLKFQRVPPQLLEAMLSPPKSSHEKPKGIGPSRSHQKIATLEENATARSTRDFGRSPKMELDHIEAIFTIIAEEVGISPQEITDTADISQLGVDSLLSLAISSKVEQSLGVHLEPGLLLENSRVDCLREVLKSTISGSEQSYDSSDSSSSLDTAPTTPTPGSATPASGNDIVINARRIIAHQIGVDEQELLLSKDLSELGVDSLLSWSISSALESELGIEIPAEKLAAKLPMKFLEAELLNCSKQESSTHNEVRQPMPVSQLPNVSEPLIKSRPSSREPLLLHRGTAQRHLFLFPDGSGSAAAYLALPKIQEDVHTWALSCPTATAAANTIPGLAQHWLQQIRQIQRCGPYDLAGWSAGGFFALEATRLILERGEQVRNIVLIDSPCPSRHEPMPLPLLECLLSHGVIGGSTPSTASGKGGATLRENFQRTITALKQYQPAKLDLEKVRNLRVSIIWASSGLDAVLPSEQIDHLHDGSSIASFLLDKRLEAGPSGWQELIPARIDCCSIAGNHFNVVQQPFCVELSRAISRALQDNNSAVST